MARATVDGVGPVTISRGLFPGGRQSASLRRRARGFAPGGTAGPHGTGAAHFLGMTTETQTPENTETLFLEYLNTLNQALAAHRNQMPYKQIIDASDKVFGDRKLGVAVYKTDPSAPHDFYTVKMVDGRIAFVSHGKDAPEYSWKTKEAFMKDVVDNKQYYVDNPSKLNWDWLTSRIGMN